MNEHELIAALARLDSILAIAIGDLRSAPGADETPDFFRGLQIRHTDVARILNTSPASPLFPNSLLASTDSGAVDSLGKGVPRLESLARTFELSAFDLNVIVIALAPEVDLRYERLYAFLQDDVTRKRPIVDLALNLFAADPQAKLGLRSRFAPGAPLLRHGLIHLIPEASQTEPSLLAHSLKLDDQVTAYLLGETSLDRRLTVFCRLLEQPASGQDDTARDERIGRLETFFKAARESGPIRIYLQGPGVSDKLRLALAVARAVQVQLLKVDLALAPEGSAAFRTALEGAFRAAKLLGAMPFLEGIDRLRFERENGFRNLCDLVAESSESVILSGSAPWIPQMSGPAGVLTVPVGVLDRERARDCWRDQLLSRGLTPAEPELQLLADRFRLTVDQVADAVATAINQARLLGTELTAAGWLDGLCAAARAECGHELNKLARKVTPKYTWDELVLPADQIAQLREICEQAEYRETVFGAWGFGRKLSLGRGLNVLFSGPPGTGKTMAAEVIANELKLDLYKIDLSQIVSKYIGETEKNLDRVFTAAEHSNAILFFDEADALFGKRSEVKDSHDRYANIEIGYLLQKMEEYEGIAILATNVKQHIDEAFVRRIQAIVEFPFPNETERGRVWQVIFPEEAPVHSDVDFSALARAVRLASGNIRSIARASAFYAAADGGVINMAHLVKASRREHQKLGRTWTEAEIGRPGAAN